MEKIQENNISQKKSVIIFLALATAIAWLLFLVMYITGIKFSSPIGFILQTAISFSPALAVILTKKLSGSKRIVRCSFRPMFKKFSKWYILAFIAPTIVAPLGTILYFLIFHNNQPIFDFSFSSLLASTPEASSSGVTVQDLLKAMIGFLFIVPIVIGEEIGWRGYLFPAMLEITSKAKAYIICAIIWGFWHAPMVAMGRTFGTEYLGFPWTGIIAYTIGMSGVATLANFLAYKTKSIWPSTVLHAANNSLGAAFLYIFLSKSAMDTIAIASNVVIIAMFNCIFILLLSVVLINRDSNTNKS